MSVDRQTRRCRLPGGHQSPAGWGDTFALLARVTQTLYYAIRIFLEL